MFGGMIIPIDFGSSPEAAVGLARLPMDMVRGNVFHDPHRMVAPLSAGWINQLFLEAWWHDKVRAV